MKKLSIVFVIIIAFASLSGCSVKKPNNSDIIGMWYSTSGDKCSAEFYVNGIVKAEGQNTEVGIYAYDSRSMEGVIFEADWIPRIHKFYYFLDDTLKINSKEYYRKKTE